MVYPSKSSSQLHCDHCGILVYQDPKIIIPHTMYTSLPFDTSLRHCGESATVCMKCAKKLCDE